MQSEAPQHFLVIAESEEDRARYSRTLLRKFSRAAITDIGIAGARLLATQAAHCAGVVINITGAGDALRLLETLRTVNPKMPIIALCTVDRSIDAFAVGATRFLLNAEWLMIGTLMVEALDIVRDDERRRWSDALSASAIERPKTKVPAA